jgi:bacillithiol system protein YtxJ
MSEPVQRRQTLPERFFPLATPADVDRLLDAIEWCAIFKAGSGDRTVDAWVLVQKALEPRVDVAVGLIQVPAGRDASNHVSTRTGIVHKSPQIILFHNGVAVAHLDEHGIQPDALDALVADRLPAVVGPRVVNPIVVSLEPWRRLVTEFIDGRLPDERFQWAYLERLARESAWRDDETFALLNGLFENPWGRDVHPARLVAHEFQRHLAGDQDPLTVRAARLLERLPPGA